MKLDDAPGQASPPYLGSGFVQFRWYVRVHPFPLLLLHVWVITHSAHPPFSSGNN